MDAREGERAFLRERGLVRGGAGGAESPRRRRAAAPSRLVPVLVLVLLPRLLGTSPPVVVSAAGLRAPVAKYAAYARPTVLILFVVLAR